MNAVVKFAACLAAASALPFLCQVLLYWLSRERLESQLSLFVFGLIGWLLRALVPVTPAWLKWLVALVYPFPIGFWLIVSMLSLTGEYKRLF